MKHISRKTTITVNAPPDKAFPLFTAKGEKRWIVDWNPIYVYPESGEPTTGMIWKTTHDHETESIWVTIHYDVEQHIAGYIKCTPEKHVTRIDIQCRPTQDNKSLVDVTYTLTSLTEQGYPDIEKLTETHFVSWIASWETSLNYYLAHKRILQTH